MTTVILLMAGLGSRMKENYNKMLIKLNGKQLYEYTIEAFSKFTDKILLVVSETDYDFFKSLNLKYKIVKGGNTRAQSVRNALLLVDTPRVLIHDGARILVSQRIINDCLNSKSKAYFTAVPVKNTIRFNECEDYHTLDRKNLLDVQTPQGGDTILFKDAYTKCALNGIENTDDVYAIDSQHLTVIEGEDSNIKVTTKTDLIIAKALLEVKNV